MDRVHVIIPPTTKLGGGYTGIALSVRLSSAFRFPAHNCFPFTPIIMKRHMQTPHEARMCPIDFEVKKSRSQCINYWKWFPAHNCFPFTSIIMKLHMQTPHESRMCPIDFEVQRSMSQCINYWKWFPAHNCFPFTPIDNCDVKQQIHITSSRVPTPPVWVKSWMCPSYHQRAVKGD